MHPCENLQLPQEHLIVAPSPSTSSPCLLFPKPLHSILFPPIALKQVLKQPSGERSPHG